MRPTPPKNIYIYNIYICVCVYLAGIDDGKKMQKEHAADVACVCVCVCVFFLGEFFVT